MPLHIGQAEIKNDKIRCLLAQKIESHLSIRSFDDLIPMRRKPHTQQFTNGRLIVDDKDAERRRAHAAVSSRSGSPATRRPVVNMAPRPSGRFAAMMVPFMASIKPREMASPSPVPGRTWSLFCTR